MYIARLYIKPKKCCRILKTVSPLGIDLHTVEVGDWQEYKSRREETRLSQQELSNIFKKSTSFLLEHKWIFKEKRKRLNLHRT